MDILMLQAAFNRFYNISDFNKDFWTRGNTFDAALRCYMSAERKWSLANPVIARMNSQMLEMAKSNINFYDQNHDNPIIWSDDFGWWGIAALSAQTYFLQGNAPSLAAVCLEIAKDCWNKMYSVGYDIKGYIKPIPNGCANKDKNNSEQTKNTVTSATFFLLSVRLYEATKADDSVESKTYLDMAFRQCNWFTAWFDPKYGYLRTFLTNPQPPNPVKKFGLTQERPIALPDYEQQDSRPTWQKGWVWTGDQGLLLGAFAEILQVTKDLAGTGDFFADTDSLADFQADIEKWIEIILLGVGYLLVHSEDKVLREAPFISSFVDDPKDYVCGRGVLCRYLSKSSLPVDSYYQAILAATAKAVWDSGNTSGSNPTYQFGADWTPGNNLQYNQYFEKAWGQGDPNVEWQYGVHAIDPTVIVVLQGLGLDVFGAAISYDVF